MRRCRTDHFAVPVGVRAEQSPGRDVRRHESGHVLQRDHRLPPRPAVLLVLRRLAQSHTHPPAAAAPRSLPRGAAVPRHGVGGAVERNERRQAEHAQASHNSGAFSQDMN